MEFLIESRSSENMYNVTVTQESNGPALTCTCPAAAMGSYCKHRLAIIDGDGRDVVRATHDVKTVPALISGTPLEEAITRMRQQEQALKDAQAELKRIKKGVARIMQGSQKQPSESTPVVSAATNGFDPDDKRPLANTAVVFSGTFEKLSRTEAKRAAEENGAKVYGNITKKADFLVCGEGAGSKAAKAAELGIRTISEAEFLAMLE
ncbi:BRCT domain-containing protein [Leisingera aquimarina]|uniref:BRCT domain-containing protein n=1 Tax=Leisingera aquimarina TaxID=476529 RepID=UPI00041D4805|nr:BRCT domain-containing protein [Leisingera aquimarina]